MVKPGFDQTDSLSKPVEVVDGFLDHIQLDAMERITRSASGSPT